MTRYDIAEAYHLYATHYHANGLTPRCTHQNRSITQQLHRMRYRPSPLLTEETLTEEAQNVYQTLVAKWHPTTPRKEQ